MMPHRWTNRDEARVISDAAAGTPQAETAAAIGVSVPSITWRREKLRKAGAMPDTARGSERGRRVRIWLDSSLAGALDHLQHETGEPLAHIVRKFCRDGLDKADRHVGSPSPGEARP